MKTYLPLGLGGGASNQDNPTTACVCARYICALVALLPCLLASVLFSQAANAVDGKDESHPALNNTTVSIPWTEFRTLLEARSGAAPERPPVDYIFSPATYVVNVTENRAKVSASVTVASLVKTMSLVPLGKAESGVLNVTVDGQPASVVMRDNTMFVLLEAGSKKIEMTMERPVAVDNGTSSFDLPLLPSPIVAVSATLPGVGLETKIGGVAAGVVEKGGATTVTASFKGGDVAAVSWTVRAPNAPEQPARVFTNTLTLATVERGGVRCRAEVIYDILQRGVESVRIALPDGVELLGAKGDAVRESNVVTEGKARFLVVALKARTKGSHIITVDYEKRFAATADGAKGKAPAVAEDVAALALPLLSHPDAVRDKGSVGIEVPGGDEVTPQVTGARRVDVKELHEHLWRAARSPILFGFTYDAPGATLALSLSRHEDVAVLVAMSDACEVTTTFTPDGKCVTKMMYVMRNNLKQFMALKLPEGAQLWSTFVNDRPVTPSRNRNGDILIPLVKSESVDPDEADDDGQPKSYRAKREKRRAEAPGLERARGERARLERGHERDGGPVDLKPYDVEIVFISPPVKFEDRGTLKTALPQSDIPCGQIAWAIFLPRSCQVLDSTGNLREVGAFSLPFRHFGEAEYDRQQAKAAHVEQAMAKALDALKKEVAAQEELAAAAKVAGVLPVRIEIPITGEIHRFEKFLAVDEAPQLTLTYRKKVE